MTFKFKYVIVYKRADQEEYFIWSGIETIKTIKTIEECKIRIEKLKKDFPRIEFEIAQLTGLDKLNKSFETEERIITI